MDCVMDRVMDRVKFSARQQSVGRQLALGMAVVVAAVCSAAIVPAQTVAPPGVPPVAGPPAAVPPAVGDVDLAGSRVYVFVGKTGLGHNHAVVGLLQAGRVVIGAAEQAGMLVFDMQSFRADTAEARKALGLQGQTDSWTQQQVTTNMTGPDVLDVAHHPTATFQIRSALAAPRQAANRPPVYELVGVFTLRGQAREVVIPVEVEQRGGWLRLRGMFSIKQTDFGMKPYTKLGGAVGVADELRINGDVLVRAAGPTHGNGASASAADGVGR